MSNVVVWYEYGRCTRYDQGSIEKFSILRDRSWVAACENESSTFCYTYVRRVECVSYKCWIIAEFHKQLGLLSSHVCTFTSPHLFGWYMLIDFVSLLFPRSRSRSYSPSQLCVYVSLTYLWNLIWINWTCLWVVIIILFISLFICAVRSLICPKTSTEWCSPPLFLSRTFASWLFLSVFFDLFGSSFQLAHDNQLWFVRGVYQTPLIAAQVNRCWLCFFFLVLRCVLCHYY